MLLLRYGLCVCAGIWLGLASHIVHSEPLTKKERFTERDPACFLAVQYQCTRRSIQRRFGQKLITKYPSTDLIRLWSIHKRVHSLYYIHLKPYSLGMISIHLRRMPKKWPLCVMVEIRLMDCREFQGVGFSLYVRVC